MNLTIFNLCVGLGWLMILAGGCLLSVGWGLLGAGFVMLALAFVVARLGGIYSPHRKDTHGHLHPD